MFKIITICILCLMILILILDIVGFIIFRRRVANKKTAVKLKRDRKKDLLWWGCCWAAWLVSGFLNWNGARRMNDTYHMQCYGFLFLAGIILTIILVLDFTVGKYAYVTSQRVYFPDNFGLARQKKNVSYQLSGSTLSLWFNNGIMPKKFTVIEKHEELAKLLKDNYKLNRTI